MSRSRTQGNLGAGQATALTCPNQETADPKGTALNSVLTRQNSSTRNECYDGEAGFHMKTDTLYGDGNQDFSFSSGHEVRRILLQPSVFLTR